MNNSKLIIEDLNISEVTDEYMPKLREREDEIVSILELLTRVNSNHDWIELNDKLFDKVIVGIERRLKIESDKLPLDIPIIYQLQGELKNAKKYNLSRLIEDYRKELQGIRQQIKI